MQMLKENRYQESNVSKIFKRITVNHSFSQSKQQTQAKMGINLQYVQDTCEKLRCMGICNKIRNTFDTEHACVNYLVNQNTR